jgi:pseudouridylate synthase
MRTRMFHDLLYFGTEIAEAIKKDRPIVVLESTWISHGMSYPDNIATIQNTEQLIRDNGAVPATIALYKGKIHIGIEQKIMKHLARSEDVVKASKRDIPFVLSRKLTASTTVAATMFCAHLAGLPLFVTGGIGHHVSEGIGISPDLIELASTPITLVCSGAKSILDLPKTLEMLESYGVAVIGYGTDEFPAFYSQSSSIPVLPRLDSPTEIATLMHYQRKLAINNGMVIANPIPRLAEIADDTIIKQAQVEAHHVNGKAITPFLLQRIAELTADQSLHANIELIKSNAILGAQIAIAYQRQKI